MFKVPAFASKCWNTSVGYYDWATCDGAARPGACVMSDFHRFNATWMGIGQLLCMGGFPVAPETAGADASPGNVSFTLTNQCSQYSYKPLGNDSDFYYVITDQVGPSRRAPTHPYIHAA